MAAQPSPAQPSPAALGTCAPPPTLSHAPPPSPLRTSQGLELEKDNATYVRCTKQELQLVVDALAQRKEESLEFKERAIEAFNVQNFKRAEQHLSSAIELDPENHVFYSNRAAAYMAMEKFDRALKDANECVRLQPTWAKGYSRQAAALLSMGDLPAAREACLKGLDLEPDNVQARAPAPPRAAPPRPPPPPPRSISLSWGAFFPDPNHDSSPRTTTPATTGKPRNRGEISAHSPAADFP
jgi:tetratricopeptide (TPR) repeat protein